MVAILGDNRMLIEMNSIEAADWMQANPDRILSQILKCETRVLDRTYPVVARFVLTAFDRTPDSLKKLEDEMGLQNGLIRDSLWIKNLSKCVPNQQFANLKILCATPKAANILINGPVYIMGSRLSIQKDIRSPGVCNKCQKYGHIVKNCTESNDICGKCSKDHRTSLCQG